MIVVNAFDSNGTIVGVHAYVTGLETTEYAEMAAGSEPTANRFEVWDLEGQRRLAIYMATGRRTPDGDRAVREVRASDPAADYEAVNMRIMIVVGQLNEVLDLNVRPHNERVTFGYLGNLPIGHPAGGPRDDRQHMVFLPHPGRVGGHDDHVGGFRTGDVAGARSCLVQLSGVLQMARRSAKR